ncbi:MAG: hypothetical protein Q9195_009205 [Heterodermia aff. obscurata]
MYAAGVPIGLLVDAKGPRPGVLFGGLAMGGGYLALQRATAFPLAAFGLGAFFFTTISVVAFPDNTSQLLILLSSGTFGLCIVSIYFVRLLPHPAEYVALPSNDRRESNPLKRNISEDSRNRVSHPSAELGTPPDISQESTDLKDADETSSLISRDSASVPGDIPNQEDQLKSDNSPDIRQPDVRGLALLRQIEFYQLFSMLGLFTGFGLMTIKRKLSGVTTMTARPQFLFRSGS